MKTESVKNRTVCSNLEAFHTSVTPKTLKKLGQSGKFVYQSCVENSDKNHVPVNFQIS